MIVGDDLFDYVRTINSRDDFIYFIQSLNADYRMKREEWENDDLESFLEGLSGFTQSIDGYYKNRGDVVDIETITWRMLAEILLAATVHS